MATVTPTITNLTAETVKITWALTSANTDGAPVPARFADYADRTVYFMGTWGGATAVLQGGDGSTYLTLTDPQGNGISKTADGIEIVTETPEFTRPNLTTAGTGATITATMILRRGFFRGI